MSKNKTGLRFHSQANTTKQQLPVGKKQRLIIDRLAHDGRGIAYLNGKTWFVAGALPTEEVDARVLAARSQAVDARCEKVLVSAPNRQKPPCIYADVCGGCELQHMAYDEQVTMKQQAVASQFKKLAGIEINHWQPTLTSTPLGYRRRARLAVCFNKQTQQLDIGFRVGASQKIVNITDCLVLDEALRKRLPFLVDVLRRIAQPRSIGHIELFVGTDVSLLVRHTSSLTSQDLTILTDFCQEHDCQLWLQGNEGIHLYEGCAPLQYVINVKAHPFFINYQPGDFVQVNAQLNQSMILKALEWLSLKSTDNVLDLFSGLGNFSLPLALQADSVVGVEAVSSMVDRARVNAMQNQLDNVTFHQTDLSLPLSGKRWAKQKFSHVLLDPPREGAFEIVKQLPALGAEQILYVSCNAATQARDAQVLLSNGYTIQNAIVMDMFPQTSHVETMLLFVKS